MSEWILFQQAMLLVLPPILVTLAAVAFIGGIIAAALVFALQIAYGGRGKRL